MRKINITKLKTHKLIYSSAIYLKRPAIFLDRDGVIIEDKHFIKESNEVSLCEGIIDFISYANCYNIPVIIITNQSGISRKLFTWEDYEKVTQKMLSLLGCKAKISAIYANGYGPNETKNNWRKPNPYMLLDAAKELNLKIEESIIIGDRLTDIIAGERAGLKFLFHIKTGKGSKERFSVEEYLEKNLFSNNINEYYLNNKYLLFLDTLKGFPVNLFKNYYSNLY